MGNPESKVMWFDPDRVKPLPGQPRKRFRGISGLARSIKRIGQKKAGVVTLIKDDPDFDAQLVDGERRLRACRQAEKKFKAEVATDCETDDDKFVASLVANFHGQAHDRMEIAEALARLQHMGYTVDEIADITGKSNCWASQHLSLLKLDPKVQEMMIPKDDEEAEGGGDVEETQQRTHLTFSLALLLVSFPPQLQVKLAQRIIRGDMSLAAARRMILQEMQQGREDGLVPARRQHQGKQRRLEGLDSLLMDFADRIGVYGDMGLKEFNALVDAVDTEQKRGVIQTIEGVIEALRDLQRKLNTRAGFNPTRRAAVPA
jgi:ParB/RepB/Spo0J family partition protein